MGPSSASEFSNSIAIATVHGGALCFKVKMREVKIYRRDEDSLPLMDESLVTVWSTLQKWLFDIINVYVNNEEWSPINYYEVKSESERHVAYQSSTYNDSCGSTVREQQMQLINSPSHVRIGNTFTSGARSSLDRATPAGSSEEFELYSGVVSTRKEDHCCSGEEEYYGNKDDSIYISKSYNDNDDKGNRDDTR